MNETKLLIFGSPSAGTPVMVAAPLAALDLPLKILVDRFRRWRLGLLQRPAYLRSRHGFTEELTNRLAGVGPLIDAAIAS